MYKILNDFKINEITNDITLEEYSNKLPDEILNVWRQYGFGDFMNGYLRIVNPNIYQELISDTYFRGKESIPIIITAFGDVITWEKNEYLGIIKYRKGEFDILEKGCKFFWDDLTDSEYVNDYLDNKQYEHALDKYGKLEFDESYGYVPLLGLGGSERVENIKKVKTLEHIELLAQMVGKIGM